MTTRTFVVLCPNGRRQQVKVSSHTSNLQVLEEACRKQGLKSEEFDLRHGNKILDLASTVQYSNLPNNGQLELVRTAKPRQENLVQIGLQLEDGQRLLHSFLPSATLWDILSKFEDSTGVGRNSNNTLIPTCVYMRREIAGEELLRATSLRSLGLVGGNAAIRFSLRPSAGASQSAVQPPQVQSFQPESRQENLEASGVDVSENSPRAISEESMELPMTEEINYQLDLSTQTQTQTPIASGLVDSPADRLSLSGANLVVQMEERNAFLFSLDEMQQMTPSDIPEEFFKITTDDVRYLMADLKRKRQELENAPLQTQEMRASQLRHRLSQYTHSVIRIIFPNRLVLQGNFKITETVADVISFVRHFLADQDLNFYLFTTPPKTKLISQQQLVTANLVPAAVVYIGCDNNKADLSVRPDMLNHLSSPEDAINFVIKNRPKENCANTKLPTTLAESVTNIERPRKPSPERAISPTYAGQSSAIASSTSPTPKWFKLGKK